MLTKQEKIAIVSDAIYPYNKGGKEKRIYEISTRLARLGYNIHIYTMQWWKGKNTKVENGVTLHAISPLYPLYSGKRRSIKEALLFSMHTFELLKEDFDIVDVDHMPHLVLFPMKLVCLLKGKKLFASWNEVWGIRYWVSYMGIFGVIAGLIEKISAQLPDKVISISSHTTELFTRMLSNKTSIVTIPCGIDISQIDMVKPSKEKFDLIFAGRLLSHKHVEVLIHAVALLKPKFPHIAVLIVGNGPEKDSLVHLISEKGLQDNIQIRDFLNDHDQLLSLFKSAKVFVFPSTREGFGLVVLEANACGIPVVTTNEEGNGAKDLIKDGINGYAIPLDNHQFAKKIERAMLHAMSKEKIRLFASTYDWDSIITTVEKEYGG